MLCRHTIGIVGIGQVGMAAANALFQQRIANELILIDLDRKRAEGEAMDLMHAQGYVGRRRVWAGDYADLVNAKIVIVTAGVSHKPGEDRLSLLNRNAAVFKQIAERLDSHAPEAIVLIASNPVDILTYLRQELYALSKRIRAACYPSASGFMGSMASRMCLSIPVAVGLKGAEERAPLPLDEGERAALMASAETLRKFLRSLSL